VQFTLPYNSTVNVDGGQSITCNVNGKKEAMSLIYLGGGTKSYVANRFLIRLTQNPGADDILRRGTATVFGTGTTGLNYRDQNCLRLGTFSENTKLKVLGGGAEAVQVCKVSNQYYAMSAVKLTNGKTAFVANKFIK
jgi:hypothetical protein